MEVRKNLKKVIILLVIVSLIPVLPASATQPTQTQINAGISKAINYLRRQQAKDGSMDSLMGKPITSAWSAMAFASAGINPQTIKKTKGIPVRKQRSLMDYLKNYSKNSLANPDSSIKVTDFARQIMAAYTVEPYPHGFGGVNLLLNMINYYDPAANEFVDPNPGNLNDDIFSAIAYYSAWPKAANSNIYLSTINFIKINQNSDDGGFANSSGGSSNVAMTSAAIQALVLAQKSNVSGLEESIKKAYDYLKASQNSDGGFPYDPNDTEWGMNLSDVTSTAWAVQAIVAYKNTAGLEEFDKGAGNDPISYLLSQQLSDGGFGWGGNSDTYTASQVIPALAKAPWPIRWNTNRTLLSTKIGIRGSRRIVGIGKYLTISGTLSPPRSGYVYLRYKRGRSKWRTLRRIKVNGPNFKTKVKISKASRYVFAAKYGADTSKKIVVYGKR